MLFIDCFSGWTKLINDFCVNRRQRAKPMKQKRWTKSRNETNKCLTVALIDCLDDASLIQRIRQMHYFTFSYRIQDHFLVHWPFLSSMIAQDMFSFHSKWLNLCDKIDVFFNLPAFRRERHWTGGFVLPEAASVMEWLKMIPVAKPTNEKEREREKRTT